MEHSAFLIRRYSKGSDGKTPEERRRGSSRNSPMLRFGENVMYKMAKTVSLKKHEERWRDGVLLGIIDH